jgi:hypothetical protein
LNRLDVGLMHNGVCTPIARSGVGLHDVLGHAVDVDFEDWRRRLRISTQRLDATEIIDVVDGQLPVECLQLAGTALLIALDQASPGAAELAERCLAGLRSREAEGDDELIAELEAAVRRRPTPDLKPISVDLEELGDALSGPIGDHPAIIDLESGQVWPAPAVEFADDLDDDEGPGEADGIHWLAAWPEGSDEAYRDMQDFIATVDDDLADGLAVAIQGKGAFRRFRDVLNRSPHEMSRWLAFSDDRRVGRARAWLAGVGYRPVAQSVPPPE